jgi:hypothetical protein
MTQKKTRKQRRRERLSEEQNGKCYYCCRQMKKSGARCVTLEHLERRVDGGGNSIDNLVAACARCNAWRDDIPPEIYKHVCKDIERLRIDRKNLLDKYKPKSVLISLGIPRNKIPQRILRLYYRLYDNYVYNRFRRVVIKRWKIKEQGLLSPYL